MIKSLMWSKIVMSNRFVKRGVLYTKTLPADICQPVINAIWHAHALLGILPDKCQDKNDISNFISLLTNIRGMIKKFSPLVLRAFRE